MWLWIQNIKWKQAPGSHRRLEVGGHERAGNTAGPGIVVSGRMIQRSQIRRLLFALCREQSAVSIVKVSTKFRCDFHNIRKYQQKFLNPPVNEDLCEQVSVPISDRNSVLMDS